MLALGLEFRIHVTGVEIMLGLMTLSKPDFGILILWTSKLGAPHFQTIVLPGEIEKLTRVHRIDFILQIDMT